MSKTTHTVGLFGSVPGTTASHGLFGLNTQAPFHGSNQKDHVHLETSTFQPFTNICNTHFNPFKPSSGNIWQKIQNSKQLVKQTPGDNQSIFHCATLETSTVSKSSDFVPPTSSESICKSEAISPFVWNKDSRIRLQNPVNVSNVSLFASLDTAQQGKQSAPDPGKGLFGTFQKQNFARKLGPDPNSSEGGLFSTPASTLVSPQLSSNLLPAVKLIALPAGFNNKTVLSKIFSRFGIIQRIICQPSLDSALIAYDSIEKAQQAKMEAETLIPGVSASSSKCVRRTSASISPAMSPQNPFTAFRAANSAKRSSLGFISSVDRRSTPVSSVEDRLSFLESRDDAEHKRIAAAICDSGSSSQNNGRSAPVLGVCLDMCPETERYLRELRQRVSVFECMTSSLSLGSAAWRMDHTRAVKDYSRSSADQAEPLPWELRPPDVLQRTMAYLLAAIADRPEIDSTRSLWKPWYEFLWTRTRAIRKDITQQGVSSPVIVGILEKIVRFHIFCAARLVDQPMDSFDARINSENLTQCLQILKELYADVRLFSSDPDAFKNEEDFCPCEPEFRAYMILMKLNDDSVLDEVQKFPVNLRKSTQVQFAMDVKFALAECNYIRFFRLVRQTDCLTACLLHRYFAQVRIQALRALSAAFNGHPRREVFYPLSTLVHQLAFENYHDARAFCEHWQMTVTDSDLIFNRQSPPSAVEGVWREPRAQTLIESKRAGMPLSVLFNGGPINPKDAIPPSVHSSFDADESAITTGCPPSTSLVIHSTSRAPSSPLPIAKSVISPFPVINASIQDSLLIKQPLISVASPISAQSALKVICNEFIDQQTRDVIANEMFENNVCTEVLEALLNEVISTMSDEVATDCARNRLHLADRELNFVFEGLFDGLISEAVECVTHRTVCEEMLLTKVFEQLVDEIAAGLAGHCFMKMHVKKISSLRTLGVFFYAWQLCLQTRRDEKRCRNRFLLMAAGPASSVDAICLAGPKVAKYCNQLLHRTSVSPPTPSKRIRFSKWAEKVDFNLAWKPLSLTPGLEGASLGFLLPPPVLVASHSTVNSGFLLNWLLTKLGEHRIRVLISRRTSPSDLSALSALICVDEIPAGCVPALPVLCLRLIDSLKASPPLEIPGSLTVSFVPSTEHYTLTYRWTPQLIDGLTWLADRVSRAPDNADIFTPDIKVSRQISTNANLLLPTPSLTEFFIMHMERTFLTPLISLIGTRSVHRCIEPSPRSVLSAYNQCASHVCHVYSSFKSSEDAGVDLSTFCIDHELVDHLPDLRLTNNASELPSWETAIGHWQDFVRNALPASHALSTLELCDAAMSKRESRFSPPKSPVEPFLALGCPVRFQVKSLLAPWALLCYYFVRAKLDVLMDEAAATPLSNAGLDEDVTTDLLRSSVSATWLEDYLESLGEQQHSINSVISFRERPSQTRLIFSDLLNHAFVPSAVDARAMRISAQMDELDVRLTRLSDANEAALS